MTAPYRLSGAAEDDIDNILDWSQSRFDDAGRRRYARLIAQAMHDVAENPQRPGAVWLTVRKGSLGLYHLRYSRRNVIDASERVQEPRHTVVFMIANDGIVNILGFLHDRMLRGRALRRMLTADDQEPG